MSTVATRFCTQTCWSSWVLYWEIVCLALYLYVGFLLASLSFFLFSLSSNYQVHQRVRILTQLSKNICHYPNNPFFLSSTQLQFNNVYFHTFDWLMPGIASTVIIIFYHLTQYCFLVHLSPAAASAVIWLKWTRTLQDFTQWCCQSQHDFIVIKVVIIIVLFSRLGCWHLTLLQHHVVVEAVAAVMGVMVVVVVVIFKVVCQSCAYTLIWKCWQVWRSLTWHEQVSVWFSSSRRAEEERTIIFLRVITFPLFSQTRLFSQWHEQTSRHPGLSLQWVFHAVFHAMKKAHDRSFTICLFRTQLGSRSQRVIIRHYNYNYSDEYSWLWQCKYKVLCSS